MSKVTVRGAYVDDADRWLNPDLIDASTLERMPQPTSWRMLVLPFKGRATSKGGIVLTKETLDREALATVVARVLKQGPLCYNDKTKYGTEPWCKEGDWVLIGRYSGCRFMLEDGEEVRIINDDEVIATILQPDDIVSFA